jgi:glycosyltransferase involved in cell wall biosynthesis
MGVLKIKKIEIGVDVTGLMHANYVTGVERVMVETNKNLNKFLDAEIYELHPFSTLPNNQIRQHAHPYLLSDPVLAKPLVNFEECDILFFPGINLNIPVKELMKLKVDKKVRILTVVYDILPLTHPEWFIDPTLSAGNSIKISAKSSFQIYLQAMFALSDQVILTSNNVKNEISKLGWDIKPEIKILPLGTFNNQVKFSRSVSAGLFTVYVSTVAPRKGHEELLTAFDLLWSEGLDVTLTLIGNKGWMIEDLIEKIETHPMKNKKLFWRQNLLDAQVDEIYAASDIAFNVSYSEGFGLSIEEGLNKGLKVIARDIPVFRERDYPNLYFFKGGSQELRNAIKEVSVLPLKPIKPHEIRTMESFANDVVQIIKLL